MGGVVIRGWRLEVRFVGEIFLSTQRRRGAKGKTLRLSVLHELLSAVICLNRDLGGFLGGQDFSWIFLQNQINLKNPPNPGSDHQTLISVKK